eukprot:10321881-Karenia_brevis.AAC.1
MTCQEGGWKEVSSRRRGKGAGKSQQDPAVTALAKELRAALMPRARGERRPEWKCKECSTWNWVEREVCRRCACERFPRQHAPTMRREAQPARTQVGQRLPQGSVWVDPKKPAERAAVLEKAVAAANAVGAPAEALA